MLQAYRLATFLKKDSNTDVFLWILQTLRTPKNIWERLLASDSSYILHRKLNKIIQEPEWPFFLLKHKITPFYFLSFIFIRFNTRRHSPSLIVIFVTCCHSLSLVFNHCHSMSLAPPLAVTRCHFLNQSWSIVVTRCHSLYHSLSVVVTLFTNDWFFDFKVS